ncbi:hypothetical protein BAX97_13445 [Elizabethkingia meningoseptica]|uniref:hypothetical protein n=1 Tax=Elizabethkingia meningoseptica TaxID=238 RepID=UPI000999FE25|nr:hypothetical protein [Elizabethkingia meningoseptica]OPC32271.1 hypothetical protein BAX97_13445 [Elizabethkingia meningoseptica]
MKKIEIGSPCKKKWEDLQEAGNDKFCLHCNKTVVDLNIKSDLEIAKLLKEDPRLCGKFSKFNIAAGLILAVSLSITSCSVTSHSNNHPTEKGIDKIVTISGKISAAENVEIKPSSIVIVTKSELFSGKIDKQNNFEIEIPESKLKKRNIIKIDFLKTKYKNTYHDHSLHLLTKKDLFSNKTLIADDGMVTIGAVVIITPQPPDFYYFNGKSISKYKYEKILKEHPDYEEIILSETSFKQIITIDFSDNIYLLYSK